MPSPRNLENRRVILASRPVGIPQAGHFALQTVPVPEPGDGQILVRNRHLSVDPAMRGWVNDVANYSPPVPVGDVMRSSELATQPGHDAAFLAALRLKLAAEPVVLAPQPLQAARRAGGAWRVPVAVAAGFVVVAGVLVVSRLSAPVDPGAAALALAAASSPGGATLRVSGAASLPAAAQADAALIRDARLDEYLRAHQSARGGIAVPGGGLRRVDAELPAGASR